MTKPTMHSGHGNVRRRKLSTKQKNTLLQKGEVAVSVRTGGRSYPKTIRKGNVKKTATGWYWEWYNRSDRHGEPAIRDYSRDAKMSAKNRPSKPTKRNYEGDFGRRT